MSEQPPLDATFFAFKRRERRFVLTSVAIAYYVLLLLIGVVLVALSWNAWNGLISWYLGVLGAISSGVAPSPPDQEIVLALAPYSLASIPISLLLFAAFEAACLRWLVRGEAGGGFFGMKLDADTWRVLGVYGLWIVCFVLLILSLTVFYGALMAFSSLGSAARVVAMLCGALAPIGFLALLIWGAVSFAPAAATSIGRRKFTFISARRVSKPRYWPLLTAFLLVIVGYVIVASIISAIFQIPINNAMAPVMAAMMSGNDGPHLLTLVQEAFFTPTMLAILIVNMLVSFVLATVYYIAAFGVNARAFEAAAEAGDVERG